MIGRGIILTGNGAELLSNALLEVKAKAYKESDVQLDDTQSSMRSFRALGLPINDGPEKRHSYFNSLGKRLVLDTII